MHAAVMDLIHERLGERAGEYLVPPPVFGTMQGEFLSVDPEEGVLVTRFPVLAAHLNPYGAMQGGMIAAAVDNTLGPLSLLVAAPNVTRRLQVKYSRPVTIEVGHIVVTGRLAGREGRELAFRAEVRDPAGTLLARARATHWIIE